MAKFKAGDMITGQVDVTYSVTERDEYGDTYTEEITAKEWRLYMVNRVIGNDYSLDNGDGFVDARARIAEIDEKFELCN